MGGRGGRTAVVAASVAFVVALLIANVIALLDALPVWSAYCLPRGEGAYDLVWAVEGRDIVSEDVSCFWPRAELVLDGPAGRETATFAAGPWFASPLVVLVVGGAGLWLLASRVPTSPPAAPERAADGLPVTPV